MGHEEERILNGNSSTVKGERVRVRKRKRGGGRKEEERG